MELIVSIVYHVFYIFLVQSLLYVTYAAEVEKKAINNLIANGLKKQITITPEVRDLFRVVLPLMRLPQTCIEYDNTHWRNFLWMFLSIAFLCVVIASLLVYIASPDTPIMMIALWNLGIFFFVGIVELMFFKSIVLKYSEVSMRDILETIRNALKTDPKKIDV